MEETTKKKHAYKQKFKEMTTRKKDYKLNFIWETMGEKSLQTKDKAHNKGEEILA